VRRTPLHAQAAIEEGEGVAGIARPTRRDSALDDQVADRHRTEERDHEHADPLHLRLGRYRNAGQGERQGTGDQREEREVGEAMEPDLLPRSCAHVR
jgi:hypothetical protein